MHLADLLIHVNEILGASEQAFIAKNFVTRRELSRHASIERQPHLLLVTYDPEATDSRGLLDRVESSGYTTQLVGT